MQKALDTADAYHDTHQTEIVRFEATEQYMKDVIQWRFNPKKLPPVTKWNAERDKLKPTNIGSMVSMFPSKMTPPKRRKPTGMFITLFTGNVAASGLKGCTIWNCNRHGGYR